MAQLLGNNSLVGREAGGAGVFKVQRNPPAGSDEDYHGHNDGATNGRTGCNRYLVHVGSLRGDSPHFAALLVGNRFRSHVELLQRDDAHDDALLGRHIFDLELAFAGLQRRSLLEGLLAEQAVDHAESQNIRRVRVPLNDHRAILAEGVLHLHFVGVVDASAPLWWIAQDKWWPLRLVQTSCSSYSTIAIAIGHSLAPSRRLLAVAVTRGRGG